MSFEIAVRSSIVIAGPTAIGKTGVAVALCRIFPGRFEIVSADSIQAYRRFDIGSAKPSIHERSSAVFHMVDVVDPDEDFTLVDYQGQANSALGFITAKGKVPLIVGGTGLYIRSLCQGLGVPIAGPDEELRTELSEIARAEGNDRLHAMLAEVDMESAQRIHQNDLKRTIRALEVFKLSGRTLTAWHNDDLARGRQGPRSYISLDRDRVKLYEVIDQRAEAMFNDGIVEEVAALRSDGYSSDLKPMTSLGYLQANQVLDGKLTKEEAIDLTQKATHQYARRQLIWFRGEPVTERIDIEGKSVDDVVAAVISTAGL